MICAVCDKLVQGRNNSTALTCAGECARRRAVLRAAAWRDGKKLEGHTFPSTAAAQRRHRKRKHGLGQETAAILAADPYGICNACGDVAVMQVDHDHAHCPGKYGCTVCVRGFLCAPCNLAAGSAKDDPKRLRAIANYLEETTF